MLTAGFAWLIVGSLAYLHLRSRKKFKVLLSEARAREAELATIIMSEPACVKTVSRDLRLLSMNPAGIKAIEADSMAQVQGADLAQVVHPDHLEDFIDLNERVFTGESVSMRFRIIGLKGTTRWMETHAAPLRDPSGAVVSHVAVTYDVSERVAMEQQLLEARDAAIAGTRAKSEFLANISHEIRTPMTAILGWTEVLQQRFEDHADVADKLGVIQQNGQHLLTVLDGVLDLSRIEAGKATVTATAIDPAALVRETRDALLPRISGSSIELRVEVADGVPSRIISDETRIRQVLINLCNNALKFTERGFVCIRVRRDDRGGAPTVIFEVEDTGSGIPPEDLDRVCQAFEQVDGSLSRNHGGVGLGLAISRSIADLLGGSLGLTSELGSGTVVRLRLPIVELGVEDRVAKAPCPDELERLTDSHSLEGCRILLAEDGRDNQLLITHLLRRAGCSVEIAGDGREALQMVAASCAAQAPFDAILMDIQMPVLDGHSATRSLRSDGIDTPVIALTAHAMNGDRERALEAGCDGYMTKPVRAADLVKVLAHHIHSNDANLDNAPAKNRV